MYSFGQFADLLEFRRKWDCIEIETTSCVPRVKAVQVDPLFEFERLELDSIVLPEPMVFPQIDWKSILDELRVHHPYEFTYERSPAVFSLLDPLAISFPVIEYGPEIEEDIRNVLEEVAQAASELSLSIPPPYCVATWVIQEAANVTVRNTHEARKEAVTRPELYTVGVCTVWRFYTSQGLKEAVMRAGALRRRLRRLVGIGAHQWLELYSFFVNIVKQTPNRRKQEKEP